MRGSGSLDVRRIHAALYSPGASDFTEVDVPPMAYLAIDGRGDPNTSPAYADAVAALYTTAYTIRFALKARTGDAWVVGPLEGLWSSPDPSVFVTGHKNDWDWTMLIWLPDVLESSDVEDGRAAAALKKPALPIGRVRRQVLDEGRSLQILHIGCYDDEAPTLARLHDEVMPARGVTWNGPHHEIYLSDPRRTAPERLRTVLRQPVRPT